MNARERMLMIGLVAIVGSGIGAYMLNEQFVKPLRDANHRIESLKDDVDNTQALYDRFFHEKKKLDAARKRSLPADPTEAVSQYNIYLIPVLRESGLTVDSVSTSQATEMKLAKPIDGVKKPGHLLVTFQVRARGELSQLVSAIKTIQATPYEHRIKNLSIDRLDKDAAKLTVTMMIELMLVAKTDSKAGPPPSPDPNLLAARNYEDIARKNIFVGKLPSVTKYVYEEPKQLAKAEEEDPPPVGPQAPDENVPSFVYLVTTDPESKTAYLRNIVYRTRETKLVAAAGSGYEFFKITDEVGSYVFFKGKILRVDQRDAYFQVKNQVYRLHIGHSLEEAMENGSLSIESIEDAGLFDIYNANREWAKKEMAGDKQNEAPKKKGRSR